MDASSTDDGIDLLVDLSDHSNSFAGYLLSVRLPMKNAGCFKLSVRKTRPQVYLEDRTSSGALMRLEARTCSLTPQSCLKLEIHYSSSSSWSY
ncbi:hypothetical protein WN944_014315 [Citrus x changshan-huyou]|uniref:Uncharacterized protein n=1 Tax=Citrus x changshan-huyou TaxID=2935761 RepID=A0AAP0QIM0_9ROSI